MRALLVCLPLIAGCVSEPLMGMPEHREAATENARFKAVVEAYLAWYYANWPTQATADGVHDHDGRLPRLSRADLEGVLAAEQDWLNRLSTIDRARLSPDHFYDALVLEARIRASLLDLGAVRPWERDPGYYREPISSGLYTLATRSFATPERRLALAAQRLRDVPSVLTAARENLKTPAAIRTEIAIDEFTGLRSFIDKTLPAAFATVVQPKEFVEAHKAALAAVDAFIDWLKKELAPRSTGSFAIGEAAYAAKLAHEEMVDTPVDELLARGEALLRATQEEFKRTASAIDGAKPAAQILKETAKEHPPADKLLDSVRAMMDDLKRWAHERVCDVPADAACAIQETPEFRRATSFASMEIPGPFETVAKEAYYSVTLPDPSWSAERQEQHLSFYNRYTLPIISVHEAYPGHYVQFLVSNTCPSKVRRVFGCGSFSEGWAHYLEQVYADSVGDPKLKLHQLHMALLRICRYIAGIKMHCRGMTVEQAIDLFRTEGYQEPENARREARRGTGDPTYLVYTLGKMEILRLRDELALPEREFHNRFIAQGYPPIKVVRMILTGSRS